MSPEFVEYHNEQVLIDSLCIPVDFFLAPSLYLSLPPSLSLSPSLYPSSTDHFIGSGLSMLNRLIEQGYYLPALRILANSTPPLFKHGKILVEDSKYVHAYM
jgi:hypothetical protein